MSRRSEVLRVLRSTTEAMTIAAIAETVGVHPNTVRFHLEALVESGQVERAAAERRTPGRPPLLFVAARGMDQEGPRDYRALAEMLALGISEESDHEGRVLAAGRAWGQRRAAVDDVTELDRPPVDRLIALLDELGFAPVRLADDDPDGESVRIGMRHCPYLELADDQSDIVCTAHLGLIRGALESCDADVTADELTPFAEPDLCIVRLLAAR